MEVPLCLFRQATRGNLLCYPSCYKFWWPVVEARVACHKTSAEDLLLNPIFRWAFLDRSARLMVFDNQLSSLESALGSAQFRTFHDQLLQDLSNHPVENYAHNRLLSAMTEICSIFHFSSNAYAVTLVPRSDAQKTYDFRADKGALSYSVEVKYIRPPDKLNEYLLRWWQAKRELDLAFPKGWHPHLKFEWEPIDSRNELSQDEIESLKDFFASVFQQPEQANALTKGRLQVYYKPDRRLPPAIEPLLIKAARSEANREGVFVKLHEILKHASIQLATAERTQQRAVYLAINLSDDIKFLWHQRFYDRIEDLRQEFLRNGIDLIVQEVTYL